VTSYESPATLRVCLESIAGQMAGEDELIIADCSAVPPEVSIVDAKLLHFPEKRSVPQMRWAAFKLSGRSLVAIVESRCIPEPYWLERLAAAHRQFPDAAGIGGPVSVEPGSRIDDGLYFNEYGRFAPPIPPGYADELSGANLSYKRNMLERERDLLDAGAWETLIHLRWRKQGIRLALCDATVRFRNGMYLGQILRQRFDYGRNYAAARSVNRFLYAIVSPALPFLLTWRLAKSIGGKGLAKRLRRSLGYVLVFSVAWSAGEFCGYLFGAAKGNRVY
jgi:hypothetical protein